MSDMRSDIDADCPIDARTKRDFSVSEVYSPSWARRDTKQRQIHDMVDR